MKSLFVALSLICCPLLAQAQSPELVKGRTLFLENCASCHGKTGLGDGPAAAAIKAPKPRNFVSEKFKYGASYDEVMKTVSVGVPGTLMPSWEKMLAEPDRAKIVKYVLSLRKNKN